MKKYIKISVLIIVEVLIIFVCVLFGKYLNSAAQKTQLLTIEKIALVNLDEGVEIDNSIKNYGEEFLSSLDNDYEITGLEQARTGLANGLYAAYIIIPSTFSQNIESINTEPTQSNIAYKINENLEESVRENVIADIVSFNNNLSTNIEYVFLDALLEEVHTVQDKSNSILENDITDLKNIAKFAESELVVDPDYVEEKYVDNDIKALDLSKEYSAIGEIFEKLSNSYDKDEKKAQAAYDAIIASKDVIDKSIYLIDEELNAIGDENNNQYIDNAEGLKKFISSYNDDLSVWKEANNTIIKKNFEQYLSSCDQNVTEQWNELSDEHKEHLKSYYTDAFKQRGTNEVTFNYDNEASENYLDIETLSSYQYLMQVGSKHVTYKNECTALSKELKSLIENANSNVYTYVTEDGEEITKEGYLMTDTDVEKLMKCVKSLVELDADIDLKDVENQSNITLKNDISQIVQLAEKQKNSKFIEYQCELFYSDLLYYGAEDKESVEKYISEKEYTEFNASEVNNIVDYFYNPNVKLVVEGDVPEEDGSIENAADAPVTTETTETPETTEMPETTEVPEITKTEKILFNGTCEMPILEEEQVNVSITNYILKPMQSSIADTYTSMKEEWNELNFGLSQFNIGNYVDDETKKNIEESFNTNISNIEKLVGEKEEEYIRYVSEVEETSKENLATFQKNIEEANKKTHSNISKSLSNIKEKREDINESNNLLLTGITNALPYTRLGELENKRVYSFIANPVEYQDISQGKEVTINEESKNKGDNRPILIVMIATIILLAGFLIIRMTSRKHDNNIQN